MLKGVKEKNTKNKKQSTDMKEKEEKKQLWYTRW